MLKKEKYWIVKNEELDLMLSILKDTKEFQDFQKGAAINNLLLSADKAVAEFKQTNRPAPATMPEAPAPKPLRRPAPKREVIEPEQDEEAALEGEPEDMDELTDEDF